LLFYHASFYFSNVLRTDYYLNHQLLQFEFIDSNYYLLIYNDHLLDLNSLLFIISSNIAIIVIKAAFTLKAFPY